MSPLVEAHGSRSHTALKVPLVVNTFAPSTCLCTGWGASVDSHWGELRGHVAMYLATFEL